MNTKKLFTVVFTVSALFLIQSAFGQDLNSNDFVNEIKKPAQQIYNIVKVVCGLVLLGSLISAGYKLYNHDNRVKTEIVLLFVFGVIVLFSPKVANWIAGTTILN